MIPSNITQESVLLLHMDREAWRAVIHGVAKSRTWLSNGTELMWSLDRLNFGWYLEICSSIYFSSGNFPSLLYSRTVVSNSLWHHAACQAFLSFTISWSCWKSCPLSRWSHYLSSPSPSAFNLSQHQGLFQWASPVHHVAKDLEFQLQYQSFQWIFTIDFL